MLIFLEKRPTRLYAFIKKAFTVDIYMKYLHLLIQFYRVGLY